MIWHPSPNFGERRGGALPDMVVIHYTAMDGAKRARDWLCNEKAEVSAHYVIARDGTCWQLVEEEMRAWHAGAGAWGSVTDVNSRSIGIELANTGSEPFPEPQMAVLEALLSEITRRWAIRPERVIGHSDMAPGRKIDPGRRFDWRRLAHKGLGVWPNAVTPARPSEFAKAAHAFGYRIESEETLLSAFRLRFRPGVKGPIDEIDAAIATNLAKRFPVDRIVLSA